MSPETIRERISAIRFPPKDLARASQVSVNTINRTLAGDTQPYKNTFDAIEKSVVAEELRLRDYLLALHPLPSQPEMKEAS